jgi:hypothetical protein
MLLLLVMMILKVQAVHAAAAAIAVAAVAAVVSQVSWHVRSGIGSRGNRCFSGAYRCVKEAVEGRQHHQKPLKVSPGDRQHKSGPFYGQVLLLCRVHRR